MTQRQEVHEKFKKKSYESREEYYKRLIEAILDTSESVLTIEVEEMSREDINHVEIYNSILEVAAIAINWKNCNQENKS